MIQNNPVKVTNEELQQIHSIQDPKVQELMANTPEGKHPFYHAIGTLGGNAVKEKYKK